MYENDHEIASLLRRSLYPVALWYYLRDKLRRMVEHPCFNKGETVLTIREIIEANNYILDVNADQINLDL